jgi:hypothetical protein
MPSQNRRRTARATTSGHAGWADAERRILHAASAGEIVDLRVGHPAIDAPSLGASWGEDRTVRADVLVELLTDTRKTVTGSVPSIKLRGARISGVLNLESAALVCPVLFEECYFDERVNLAFAEAVTVRFPGCAVPSIDARGLRTSRELDLGRLSSRGPVVLSGARIGGQLYMSGATLVNPNDVALSGEELTVEQSMFCRDGFTVTGELRLNSARIGGRLYFSGARLINDGALALAADRLHVDQNIHLNDGFSTTGCVWLMHARVGGLVDLRRAKLANRKGPALVADYLTAEQGMIFSEFSSMGEVRLNGATIGIDLAISQTELENPDGPALTAEDLVVEKSVFADELAVNGELRLSSAHIGRQLTFNNVRIDNMGGTALAADHLSVGESMFFRNGSVAIGEIRLLGASIGGDLDLRTATLTNPDGMAFNADRLSVNGDLSFTRITAQGMLRLPSARIGGHIYFNGARIANPNGWALALDQITVEQNMQFHDFFSAEGDVRLGGAHIKGQLSFAGANLRNPGGVALNAEKVTVDMDLFCRDGFSAVGEVLMQGANVRGVLDFTGARLNGAGRTALSMPVAKVDYVQLLPAEPPDGSIDLRHARVNVYHDDHTTSATQIDLDGFSYETLANDIGGIRARLAWLSHNQSGYSPGPYDQLAAAYRRAGQVENARRVGLEKQKARRSELNWTGKVWNWLLYLTVGYGYRTWLAAVWLFGLLATGSVVFTILYPADLIATQAQVPPFQPIAYALDVLLPIVDLGQQKAWLAQGPAQAVSWVLIIAGWILATAVIAGLTNALKRD